MASEIPDDGFHEIQLNGKQLVFLFMAATVVSVVIFLCGVLVGRGVRAERSASSSDATATVEPTPQGAPAAATPAGSDPTAAVAAPPTVDDLSYFNRLEKPTPPAEDLKLASAAATPPASARQAAAVPAPTPVPAPVAAAPTPEPPVARTAPPKPQPVVAPAVAAAPPGDGYVIQVAAMREHTDADAMARRLTSKGYSAFVVAPGAATPTMYRVRVGRFKTKREAETIASRLQKEEQFKPWITR